MRIVEDLYCNRCHGAITTKITRADPLAVRLYCVTCQLVTSTHLLDGVSDGVEGFIKDDTFIMHK